MTALTRLDPELDSVPGTVSVWYGRPGFPPAYARRADATHYAASTMKLAVLVAAHRGLDLTREVPVHNDFVSVAAAGGRFGCRQRYDNDDAVWDRLGTSVRLGWLVERMIVRSSNLATNLVLERVGIEAADHVWRAVGARHSTVARPIEDRAAADEGIANLVTAVDLATLLAAILDGRLGPTAAMIDTLLAQESRDDLMAGLPAGARAAHKNGWVTGVRHSAGIVFPPDADPFVLAVCLSTPWAINRHDDAACQLVARIAAAAWADRR